MELWSNIVLTCVLLANVFSLAALVLAGKHLMDLRDDFRENIDSIRKFVTAPDEKTPSPLAQTIEVASTVAGRAIAREVKTTLMGKASGDSRLLQAVENDIRQDVIDRQSPLLGAFMQSNPRLMKRMGKSPNLMDLLIQYLPQFLGGRLGSTSSSFHSGSNGGNTKVDFEHKL